MKNGQDLHEHLMQGKGEHSVDAITSGTLLAVTFSCIGPAIESERLLTKQMRLSLQTHGRDHDLTKSVNPCLELVKQREVIIPSQPGI